MKKLSKRWIITGILLAISLIFLIVTLCIKIPKMNQYKATLAARNTSETNAEFLKNSTVTSECEAPYLESGIDGVYFTADYDGNIKFYKFSNGNFESVGTSKTITVTLPNTEKGTAKISFITINDQTVGYGVYSNKKADKSPYAFIKVIPNTITENYDYIAFVDYTIDDYYRDNKTYENICVFSAKESKLTEVFSFENDSSIIPTDLIEARNDGFYYFSKNEDGTYSLFVKTTVYGKEYSVSDSLALPYAFNKDGALLLLETDKLEGLSKDTKFYLIESGAIEQKAILEFNNDPSEYLVKDNYILCPSTKLLYDVISGTSQTVNVSENLTEILDFDVTQGGSKIAIAGTVGDKTDMLLLYEFSTDSLKLIGENNLFLSDNPNITATDGYIMFLSPYETADYVKNIVIPWEKVF